MSAETIDSRKLLESIGWEAADEWTCTCGTARYTMHPQPCHKEAVARALYERACHGENLVCTEHLTFSKEYMAGRGPDAMYSCAECHNHLGRFLRHEPLR